MKKKTTIITILVIFTITGCSTDLKSTIDETQAVPSPTVVEATSTEQAEPTNTPITIETAAELVSECTVVSSLPGPEDEIPEVFSIKEDDWVIGPEDAAITLIEYGDFQ